MANTGRITTGTQPRLSQGDRNRKQSPATNKFPKTEQRSWSKPDKVNRSYEKTKK